MGHRLSLNATKRAAIFALFACALLVRALVPAGWMPAVGSDGGTVIQLCSGAGAVEMVLAADGTLHEKVPDKHDSANDHPCAFAGMGQAFAAADPYPPLAPLTPRFANPLVMTPIVSVGRGLAAPPPPQTGPPILV